MTTVRPTRHRGFTLIELLVVIGIIVILVGILLPTIARVRRAAYGAATLAQLTTIANAIQQYYGDFRAYPGPLPNNQIGQTLAGFSPVSAPMADSVPMSTPDSTQYGNITGSENLTLGLLGGLQLSTSGSTVTFGFNSANVGSGALSLNYTKPKRNQSYLQVATGDLTNSSAQSVDSFGRVAQDTVIPEFVDKFANHPNVILYMRANAGGTAVADIGGKDDSGTALVDANSNPVVAQWDLQQILGYTRANPAGGLQGLGTGGSGTVAMTDTITSGLANGGKNALAYLKDPTANSTTATNIGGAARQKDGFILISAGPDGIYGTADDIIYPGSLNP